MLKVCSYSNVSEAPSFIQETEHLSHQRMLVEKEFFSGSCFKCGAMTSEVGTSKDTELFAFVNLQRCAGCQLVSYCSKNCQKADWKDHRKMCKDFPVENGKNVIAMESESFGSDQRRYLDVVMRLQGELNATMIQHELIGQRVNPSNGEKEPMYATRETVCDNLFMKARACNVCHEARPDKLFDCHCCSVSYCSRAHLMQDEIHQTQHCDLLYGCAMANWYLTTYHHQLQIPDGLLNYASLNYGLRFEEVSKLSKYSSEKWLETIVNLINERLTFPLTIYHALKKLKIGKQRKSLDELSSLTVHIHFMTPILDPRIWEFFLHEFPNLKKLNITFISGVMKIYNKYNSYIPVKRCKDCKRNQRVITYNLHPMHYHEYFSSDDYVEPDVVAVFGSSGELSHNMRTIDKAHRFTCYKNMTEGKHTIVILTELLERFLESCVKSFHDARPVKVLLPVQENPGCGFSTLRNGCFNVNPNDVVCCIQRKQ